MTIVSIPNYRTKSRNKTITAHWRTYQRYRTEIADLIACYGKKVVMDKPVLVSITAYFKGKVGIDTSNIDDKLIIDGLMHAGFLVDDAPAFNPEVRKRSVLSSGKDELVIELHPIGN